MLSTKPSIVFILLFAALILKPHSAFSQDYLIKKIDSIFESVEGKANNEKRSSYQEINTLVVRKGGSEIETLIKYALTKDSSDFAKIIFYDSYSKIFSRRGDTDEALRLKKEALAAAEKLKDTPAITGYNIDIGNVYLFQNIPDKALEHFNIAEPYALEEESGVYRQGLYYNKGLLSNMLGDYDAQRINYLKMWDAVKDWENTSRKRFVLYTLVDFFAQVDYPEQLAKFTEILASYYEEANPDMPEGHMPIKSIFERRADPANIPELKRSIEVSDSLNSLNSYAFSSIALAQTYEKMGQHFEAVGVLDKASQKINASKKPQIKLYLYSELSRISALANNYKDALQYKIQETAVRDTITSDKMQRNIAELEVKFDTEQKERKIAEQNLELEKETRQKNQILIGLIALGLLLVVTYLFFRKRLQYQKTIAAQNEAIQQKEILALQQENKLLALNSMIEGQEAERLRIAKDLHDSLGGLLSTVKAHFTTIQKEIEQLEKLNITEKTNSLIDEACIEVRRISHNMMPHALSMSGLEGAISDAADNFKAEGYQVTLEVKDLPEKIEGTREIMIYRLIQEILSNIRKHADAKSILIQLISHENEINLMVEDDGKGFNFHEALEKGGLGLKSINSRVQFLDGSIDWDTAPGKGTTVNISIPKTA